jgi:sporulation protein YunB
MIKNSILYRRLWYVKRRNGNKINILTRIIIIVMIFTLFTTYANKKLFPYLIAISESRVESVINNSISNIVEEVFAEEYTEEYGFGDIIITNKNSRGEIISIYTNIVKLNRLSVKISSEIQNQLSSLKAEKVSIPLGMLLGNTIFSSIGPRLFISIQPYGSVETEFKSEYYPLENNQSKYTLYLQVKTKAGIEAPFFQKKSDIITNVQLVEKIIVKES